MPPLNKKKSKAAIKENIKTELAEGKGHTQAVAIALSVAGKKKKKAKKKKFTENTKF